jgi:hypothetical protein
MDCYLGTEWAVSELNDYKNVTLVKADAKWPESGALKSSLPQMVQVPLETSLFGVQKWRGPAPIGFSGVGVGIWWHMPICSRPSKPTPICRHGPPRTIWLRK